MRTRSPSPACQVARRSGRGAGSARTAIGAIVSQPRRRPETRGAPASEPVTPKRPRARRAALRWGGRSSGSSSPVTSSAARTRSAAAERTCPRTSTRSGCSASGIAAAPAAAWTASRRAGSACAGVSYDGGELPDGAARGRARRPAGPRAPPRCRARGVIDVAGEHAGVADRVVDLRDAAGVAVEQDARGAARRRELRGLLAGADLLLDLADHLVDPAGVDQRALGGAGVAGLERGRDPLERAPELHEHRLGEAAGGQRGVGREEEGADGERDGAADGALGDAGRREAALGRAGVERDEQDRGDGRPRRPRSRRRRARWPPSWRARRARRSARRRCR